jgi:hypothetical protein
MAKRGYPYYAEQLKYILAVTEMLNNADIPSDGGADWYLDVRICNTSDGSVVGSFSDEISSDAWEWAEEVSE